MPQSIDLEQRLSSLEVLVQEILEATTTRKLRLSALQAHLNHVAAKLANTGPEGEISVQPVVASASFDFELV